MPPRFEVEGEPPAPPTSRTKKNSKSKNQPAYNVRAHLVRILGIDLVDVIGISESLAQTIISEIGTDMSAFPPARTSVPGSAWRPTMTSPVARCCAPAS